MCATLSGRATLTTSLPRNRPPKSGPTYAVASRTEWPALSRHNLFVFCLLEIGSLWATPLTQQGSHAQRTPLNMGALHCVTGGHTHSYKARTSGEIKETLHPLRLHTSTRGFDTTVELQEATASAILFLSVCRGGKLASGERCEVESR